MLERKRRPRYKEYGHENERNSSLATQVPISTELPSFDKQPNSAWQRDKVYIGAFSKSREKQRRTREKGEVHAHTYPGFALPAWGSLFMAW